MFPSDPMFSEIVDKVITGIERIDDGDTLVFSTAEGTYRYQGVGDCCNRCWVENIGENLYALIGRRVMFIDEKYFNHPTNCSYAVVVTIVTDLGHYDIEFRNDADHYAYGGTMRFRGFFPHESAAESDV